MSSTIKEGSAIQPPAWAAALPRPEYQNYERVLPEAEWYEVYRIAPNTYAFYEPGHFQEVLCFLLLGEDRALLWDTGMGFAPLRPLVERQTALPVTVVNSHLHFDHVAANHEFGAAYAWPSSAAAQAREGYDPARILPNLADDAFARPLPDGMTKESYTVHPWEFRPLPDPERAGGADGLVKSALAPSGLHPDLQPLLTGLAIDLGGRVLDILHTPGHSIDSIMLLDRAGRALYTGDMIYPAALYAHMVSEEYDVFPTYCDTVRRLQHLDGAVDTLCTSHNLPTCSASLLRRVAALFEGIQQGTAAGTAYADGLLRYEGEDFAVIVRQ